MTEVSRSRWQRSVGDILLECRDLRSQVVALRSQVVALQAQVDALNGMIFRNGTDLVINAGQGGSLYLQVGGPKGIRYAFQPDGNFVGYDNAGAFWSGFSEPNRLRTP